ncbi:Lar family restriction alleviation protein [Candidatus Saccharibacteria bacterium]|nr:Lar family restriction alleviation protein [Candidatus Saccharibacteria bacterium]
MIVLNPCPKCGGKAKLIRGLPNMGNSKTLYALVQCRICHYKTPTLRPEEGESGESLKNRAIALWNNEQPL